VKASTRFLRGLVAACALAILAPALVFLLAPLLGAGVAVWLLLGSAAAFTLSRAAAAQRGRHGRGIAADLLLLLASAVFAFWLLTPGLLGAALAAWGFGFCLSLRAFLPDPDPGLASAEDRFEAARTRALALLEEEP
jgi:hypothetical protein